MKITEALAEIKTLAKRIEKKREFIEQHVARPEQIKDPLSKDGGAPDVIKRELQAIRDLFSRIVAIRVAIQQINQTTTITVGDQTKTVAEWLAWRKEVAPIHVALTDSLANQLNRIRQDALRKGANVISGVSAVAQSGEAKPTDIVVNVSELDLSVEREMLQKILGELDGQLSLKNATIDVPLNGAVS